MDNLLSAHFLDELTTLVSRAAAAVLTIRAQALHTQTKPDRSPVTAADHASEAVIVAGVARLLPGIPIVSEEGGCTSENSLADTFVLVDPVDGTRELVAGRDEFAINLAIVCAGRPILGIISAPAHGLIWRAVPDGAERLRLDPGAPASAASERAVIRTRPWPERGIVATVSRSHLDPHTQALLARLPVTERLVCGSAVKFCYVAEGGADIYPRLSPTHEWDVAAGDAILTSAGGKITTPDGAPLPYGRRDGRFLVPGFIAWGDRAAATRLDLIASRKGSRR